MTHSDYLVIGSGASAAMTALALSQEPDTQVTVLDLGEELEADRRERVARLAAAAQQDWAADDLAAISEPPVATTKSALPQKRTYGSDFPFRDLGQTTGISGSAGANLDVVSSAYGGFTNLWGAQFMPFSRSTFDTWPVGWQEMEPHYRAVLGEVPLAADVDDLDQHFPLLNPRSGLPPLSARTERVLSRYEQQRDRLASAGVTVGRARLAFHARDCVRCGLCMTGCPYALIYSAAQTMTKVRRRPNVSYHDRLLVERVGQDGQQAFALCRDQRSGERVTFRADRVFVGAGGLGTTRLMLGSLPSPPPSVELGESLQFLVPFLSARPTEDVLRPDVRDFSLNQFNVLVGFDDTAYHTSQVHCYPYNPAMLAALPAVLQHRAARPVVRQLLRRMTVGLGYLPSWASPRIRVSARAGGAGRLPELSLAAAPGTGRPQMLAQVLRRLVRVAPRLDLWPVLSHVSVSGLGKSYHFGGSFPHQLPSQRSPTGTDRLGRVPAWERVHLVDGSVLPSIPSTTFTMTVMANAHRIATEAAAADAHVRARLGSSLA